MSGASPQSARIRSICVGTRYRKDLGDIPGLARDIKEIGLLHPIVVTPNLKLIAGKRRLVACEALGWVEVPVHIVDLDEVARGEWSENHQRKPLLPSEEVAIWRALHPKEAAKAKERETLGKTSPGSEKGRARDRIAANFDKSGRTLEKQVAIVEAAEAEPEKYRHLVADMDRTGRVDGPHNRLVVAQKAEAIRAEPPPLPSGPFRVIAADPPWPYDLDRGAGHEPGDRATYPYPAMSLDAIAALEVGALATDDALLWLWTTNFHMEPAHGIARAWGFEKVSILTWVKNTMGHGSWLRGRSEHALLCTRGSPTVTLSNETTVIEGAVRAHSQKPETFYELVETLCPGAKVELFQIAPREGWVGHGAPVAPPSAVSSRPGEAAA